MDAMRRVKSSPDPAEGRAQLCDARAKKNLIWKADLADLPEVVSNSIFGVCARHSMATGRLGVVRSSRCRVLQFLL